MGPRVRFLIEASGEGSLVARGIDIELSIEAPSLTALEREVRERVRAELGADREVSLLVGAPRRER